MTRHWTPVCLTAEVGLAFFEKFTEKKLRRSKTMSRSSSIRRSIVDSMLLMSRLGCIA